jgi:hypothetical protein
VTLLECTPAVSDSPATAELQAGSNYAAAIAALGDVHPALADRLPPTAAAVAASAGLTWTFARDGSLSAMDANQLWWAGCSVPLLAGRSLLKTLEPSPQHSCLLLPPHAGLLRAARQRMGDWPAILCIIPDEQTLAVILATHNFGHDIRHHRLWFAAGQQWAAELRKLFDAYPGLSTPGRFIKSKLLDDESAAAVITAAQDVFSAVLNDRVRQLESLRASNAGVGSTASAASLARLLLLAGSGFRLWEDSANVLADVMSDATEPGCMLTRFDGDDPASSSPLALAMAARDCGAIVSANVTRADAPNLVDLAKPWITWLTRPCIPPAHAAGPHDALLLADPAWQSLATAAGWPAERLAVAAWPVESVPPAPSADTPHLALLADTTAIEAPRSIVDMSSHLLLWEAIDAELRDDPLALGSDLPAYLRRRCEPLGLSIDALDSRRFIEQLLLPAYTQGLARLLLREGLALRLYGQGWEVIPEFAAAARGPIISRDQLRAAAGAARGMVYPWPVRHAHPLDSIDRPILHATASHALLAQARAALAGRRSATRRPTAETVGLAHMVLRQIRGKLV